MFANPNLSFGSGKEREIFFPKLLGIIVVLVSLAFFTGFGFHGFFYPQEKLGEFTGFELSDSDKLLVARARKIQRFLSQPFSVAEQFTGMEGKYLPLKETVRSFKEILEGKHDEIPESMFLLAGGIDEVVERFKKNG